jgi:hypothetical protein
LAIVSWKEYNHPQFGKIEVGGMKKNFTLVDSGFLLESVSQPECIRAQALINATRFNSLIISA